MRALVVARTRNTVPPEMLPMVAQGFVAWREQYRDNMENFSFFAGGNGGFGIANVADENELYQMMLEWPLTPFSDLQVDLFVDGDEALSRWSSRIEQMAEMMS